MYHSSYENESTVQYVKTAVFTRPLENLGLIWRTAVVQKWTTILAEKMKDKKGYYCRLRPRLLGLLVFL